MDIPRTGKGKAKMNWLENIDHLGRILNNLSVRNIDGNEIAVDQGFSEWQSITSELRAEGRTAFLIGNGASASMASHFAADLSKNARVLTQTFFDLSLLTAIGNDIGYEDVYSEPLRQRIRAQDMLIAISSSGMSPNILKAVREARQRQGIIITLSAMQENNILRTSGDFNFYIPARSYGDAETSHAAILHYWTDMMTGTTIGD